jgi:hypothetical protein
VSVKISRQGVDRSTTYPKHLHGLADEVYSSLKRMEVCGWQMRHARGGWPHARCEGESGKSARPGQYALLCSNKSTKYIPKQLCSHAMKLVVLFSRRARCVVVWCGAEDVFVVVAEARFGWRVTAASPTLPKVSDDIWSRKVSCKKMRMHSGMLLLVLTMMWDALLTS